MALCVGFDTSNYTTSIAWCDGEQGRNESRILDVPEGALGLRQSDALFSHVRRLPQIMEQLLAGRNLKEAAVIAASSRPRETADSYMPCFLAGVCEAKTLASALGAAYIEFSHQQGHLAAAAWSCGQEALLDRPFLAWHLSGGTTELLHVKPAGAAVHAEKIGGTTDISAGQFLDRTGVMLQLPFPAGKHVDALCRQASGTCKPFRVKLNGLYFSLSGMENKVKAFYAGGESAAEIARFAVQTVADTVYRTTEAAKKMYPGLPILCSGGVASNSVLRERMAGAFFAPAEYSRDNAMGIAVLAKRALERGEVHGK